MSEHTELRDASDGSAPDGELAAAVLRTVHDAVDALPHHRRLYADIVAPAVTDALIAGPLAPILAALDNPERRRLQAIGAWVVANEPYNFNTNRAGHGSVASYRAAALAAGAADAGEAS